MLDCLSVAFAFLPTRDFGCALRCSRTWFTVGCRQTAWPTTSVEAVTAAIQANAYGQSAARRITVNATNTRRRRGLQRARHSVLWRKVEDVHVWTEGDRWANKDSLAALQRSDDAALRAVACLPAVKVLNLGLFGPTSQAVQTCFTALAPKLECLLSNVAGVAVVGNLSVLTQLRSLAIKIQRPYWPSVQPMGTGLATQLAKALSALTCLQYFHYEDTQTNVWHHPPARFPEGYESESSEAEARGVLMAVHELSARHALRDVSLCWRLHGMDDEIGPMDLSALQCSPLPPTLPAPPPLRIGSLQLNTVPTAAALATLSHLPGLTQLEWTCYMSAMSKAVHSILAESDGKEEPRQVQSLHTLRLEHLREGSLATLYPRMSLSMLEYFIARFPALEVLHLDGMFLPPDAWPLMPRWTRLRELHIKTALQLSVVQVQLLLQWSSWQVIHIDPARRGSACGCKWRLVRLASPLLDWSTLRLVHDAPEGADAHSHSSGEYCLQPVYCPTDATSIVSYVWE